jgi:ribose 5-phosphate isomerase B
LCWKKEIAQLARSHNNANVLALPARFIKEKEAIAIVDTFFSVQFEGGRHQKRVEKI